MKHLIARHYAIASLGYFSILSTLLLILTHKALTPSQLAIAFTTFTVLNRLAKLAVAPWLDRHPPASGILIGCLLTSASILLIGLTEGFVATLVVLSACATGISINAIASKQFAAGVSEQRAERLAVFSLISAVGNLAAAVAAPLATLLLAHHGAMAVGVLASAAYAAAGLSTWWLARSRSAPGLMAVEAVASTWSQVLAQRGLLRFCAVNAMGWFLYYQMFSVVPLQISGDKTLAPYLGVLLTGNTLLIAALQVPVSKFAARAGIAEGGVRIVVAYAVFALAFLVLGVRADSMIALSLFVVIYSAAEMLFVPTIDALFLDRVSANARAKGYALLSISTAIGEGFGSLVGLHLHPALHDAPIGYWWFVGAVAVAFSVLAHVTLVAPTPQPRHA